MSVIRDAEPWAPTAVSPGVCNKGGSKQACYDTDEKVVVDLQQLLDGLRKTSVPQQFGEANTAMKDAIALDIRALTDRDTAIAQDNSDLFGRAVAEVLAAKSQFNRGYAKFPSYDQPIPRPFGLVGYSG